MYVCNFSLLITAINPPMATLLQLLILIAISTLISFSVSNAMPITIEEALSPAFATTFLPQSPSDSSPSTDAMFVATHYLEPVLTHLGFHQLAMAVPSLSTTTASAAAAWTGPSTIFAPSDASIHSCSSCSVPRLLQEHIVPGVFSLDYLRSLAFGTKIETIVPGRCITITFAVNNTKIFVGGVEITRPELFNNGLFVVHGLDGFVSHLAPLSCNVERMTSLSFPPNQPFDRAQSLSQYSIMRMMLTDAILRLRITGFGILALALRVKSAELMNLQNMTVFALDDSSIFTGGHAYVSNVRFHIVPNRILRASNLERLPLSTVLPTLEEGQKLVVTTAGGGMMPMRINYVRIKTPDVMHNLRIVVHELLLPFPHLHPTAMGYGWLGLSGLNGEGTSEIGRNDGIADVAPTAGFVSTEEIEDHHGL